MFRAIKKYLHNLRRKRIAAAKELAYVQKQAKALSRRMMNKIIRREQHHADVKSNRERGVRLHDGSLATMEWRWVRRALFKAGALHRKQPKFPSHEGGIKVIGD